MRRHMYGATTYEGMTNCTSFRAPQLGKSGQTFWRKPCRSLHSKSKQDQRSTSYKHRTNVARSGSFEQNEEKRL